MSLSRSSFNISTDGKTTSDQLQAYRCVGATGIDVSKVQVGDEVVVSGNLKKHNDTYEFAITVFQQKETLQNVRIFALTNGLVKPINFSPITLENTEISFGIWDMDRLYRCATSGKMRETTPLLP